MDGFFNKVFAMPKMVLFLFLFFLSIGWATFIENDFGREIAYKWVYLSWWFSVILIYLSVSLIYNIIRFKLYKLKKISSLLFHAAFLVIVLGAIATRFTGFEGVMMIREGDSSSEIISGQTYFQIKAHDNVDQYTVDLPLIIDTNSVAYVEEAWSSNPLRWLFNHNNFFEHSFPFKDKKVKISTQSIMKNPKDTLIPTAGGDEYVELVTGGMEGRTYNYLKSGEVKVFQTGLKVAFNNDEFTDAIRITTTDSGLFVMSPFDLDYLQMSDQSQGLIVRDSVQEFIPKRLYMVGGDQFAFNQYYIGAVKETIAGPKGVNSLLGITLKIEVDGAETTHIVKGGKGLLASIEAFQFEGLNFEIGYGSKAIEVPFFIHLRDFELERYPGTMNPSSFSSEVTLIDLVNGVEDERRIFMNNVLDYGGYRFFQSSYDRDEKGTILSVNHDALGTNLTYLGYLFLALGFIINLLAPKGRFRTLMRKTKELRLKREAMTVLFFLVSVTSFGQEDLSVIDEGHAEKFSKLVVQSHSGRFVPVHTLADELVRKIHRGREYKEMNPVQVFLGIQTNPVWFQEPFIYVSGPEIREEYNLDGKYAALSDFLFIGEGHIDYLLQEDAESARIKKPANRSQYDKDVLKTDERINIMFGIFNYSYLKIFPKPKDSANNWYSPYELKNPFEAEDSTFISGVMKLYFAGVAKGYQTDNWDDADKILSLIDTYQQRTAGEGVLLSDSDIELEIWYNDAGIFKKLQTYYGVIGFFLLVIQFFQIFIPKINLKWPIRLGLWLFACMFVFHGIGLGLRWYLSGHAPWSNGYEAVVFIAFITILAGLLFYRQSKVVLGATGILAWLMLFVAHMNHMDPEITNLVPVLKSYWLMIHVAIITGSYGFLGLGAILSLIVLSMYLFVTKHNVKRMMLLSKELSNVTEMTITIGLFMLTIGTFLGGVWANESWGRYWGWDAKETWALASVLIYAVVLHIRFIPFMKSRFAFNLWSFWAYASIVMTFFGVNYYLSGLHSYAQGDPLPIPNWVPITIILLIVFSVLSFMRWLNAKSYAAPEIIAKEAKAQAEDDMQ